MNAELRCIQFLYFTKCFNLKFCRNFKTLNKNYFQTNKIILLIKNNKVKCRIIYSTTYIL